MCRNNITRQCKVCNADFQTNQSEIRRGYGTCCSRKCGVIQSNLSRQRHILTCQCCGEQYTSTISTSKYCSYTCKMKQYRRSANSTNRISTKSAAKRLSHLSCEICGWDKSTRDVHHIVPVAQGGNNEADNLVVLCPNCHREAHNNLISQDSLREAIKSRTISSSSIIEEQDAVGSP